MRIFLAPEQTYADPITGEPSRGPFAGGVWPAGGAESHEITPGWFLVVAPGLTAAPSDAFDLGDNHTVTVAAALAGQPGNPGRRLQRDLGLEAADLDQPIGSLLVQLLPRSGGVLAAGRNGRYRISLAGVTLLDLPVVAGGAVEWSKNFSGVSNGRLQTVDPDFVDSSSSFQIVSEVLEWSAAGAQGYFENDTTPTGSGNHSLTYNGWFSSSAVYSAHGAVLRCDGSGTPANDGYRCLVSNNATNRTYYVSVITAGSKTDLANTNDGSPAADSSSKEWKIAVDGNTISFYEDGGGTPVWTYGSATAHTANEYVGGYCGRYGGGSLFMDNLVAESIGAATVQIDPAGASSASSLAAAAVVPTPQVAPASASSASSLAAAAVVPTPQVGPASASSASSLDQAGVVPTRVVAPDGASSASSLAAAAVVPTPAVGPAGLVVASSLDQAGVVPTPQVAPAASSSGAVLEQAAVTTPLVQIDPAGASSTPSLDQAGVVPTPQVAPAGSSSAAVLEQAAVSTLAAVDPAGLAVASLLEQAGVVPTQVLAPASLTSVAALAAAGVVPTPQVGPTSLSSPPGAASPTITTLSGVAPASLTVLAALAAAAVVPTPAIGPVAATVAALLEQAGVVPTPQILPAGASSASSASSPDVTSTITVGPVAATVAALLEQAGVIPTPQVAPAGASSASSLAVVTVIPTPAIGPAGLTVAVAVDQAIVVFVGASVGLVLETFLAGATLTTIREGAAIDPFAAAAELNVQE